MNRLQNLSLFLVRLTLGWMFFYAGITKILAPAWSAEGYIKGATHFVGMFQWFLSPSVLPVINWLNMWGLTLVGVSLILGIAVRFSSLAGMMLMALYYLAALKFPYPNPHAYLVDEHIIYISVFFLLFVFHAGKSFGLAKWCSSLPLCKKFPRFRALLD